MKKAEAEIVFWERSIGADFPPFTSSIPLRAENIEKAKNWRPFSQDGFMFDFSEEVHSNGCWATKPDKSGQCKVSFHIPA
jgi:hypothetical protein